MSDREQTKVSIIHLNKWPVSFSEWTDAYIVQILNGNLNGYTVKGKKDTREGLMDKLMFRMKLIFESFPVYRNIDIQESLLEEDAEIDLSLSDQEIYEVFGKKDGRDIWHASSSTFALPEGVEFFLEENWGKRQFEVWKEEKRREIFALARLYRKLKMDVDKLKKRLNKEQNHDKYLKLEMRLVEQKSKLERMKKRGKGMVRRFRHLDVADFLKVHMFETVSKYESDFYCILLDEKFFNRKIQADLEDNKWWIIDVDIREKLLRCLERLLKKEKWGFAEKEYYLIVQKLLRPHEYILAKETKNLLQNVSLLYSVGNNQSFRFFENDDAGMMMGERIVELTENVKKTSEELWDYVERNGSNPNIVGELKKIGKMFCERKNREY